MTLEPAEILSLIQEHRHEARRVASALKQDVITAHANGLRDLADTADALSVAITTALNAHPCDASLLGAHPNWSQSCQTG